MSFRFIPRPNARYESADGFGEYCRQNWTDSVAAGASLLVIVLALPSSTAASGPASTAVALGKMPFFWFLKAAEVLLDGSCREVGERPTTVEVARVILANLVEYHNRGEMTEREAARLSLKCTARIEEAARALLADVTATRKQLEKDLDP